MDLSYPQQIYNHIQEFMIIFNYDTLIYLKINKYYLLAYLHIGIYIIIKYELWSVEVNENSRTNNVFVGYIWTTINMTNNKEKNNM